ncbi:MAG: hypothetical protein M1837_002800 [Sclerophora amabilis]|nr:MAG: hypothetical protein M1837_002800 [Sclerophora amabilis]
MIDIFGQNVATVEGKTWQRHRRITATPFNEHNNKLVWTETRRQSHDMLKWWLSHQSPGLKSMAKDTRALSLNVLAYVGYRTPCPFDGASNLPETLHATSFRDSLADILDNAMLTLAIPPRILRSSFVPKKWSRVGSAITAFRSHMMNLFNEETRLCSQGKQGTGSLMTSIVGASEQACREAAQRKKKPEIGQLQPKVEGLSVDEILGNIFVYYFAGHDTTAAVFTYAILLLAANPEYQDWIAEELQHFLTTEDSETWSYECAFPKLQRCLALLLETIRLYDPVPGLPKWTGESDRCLKVKGQTLVIPARTMIIPSLNALQTHPRYWGEDSLVWRPTRWIIASNENSTPGSKIEEETMFVPPKGTYFPWSDGQRNCPGKKFSKVEFVAAMATLFRDHRVHPVLAPGENQHQARERVLDVVNDTTLGLLRQVRNPNNVSLAWDRR